jgi:hypothetical protein
MRNRGNTPPIVVLGREDDRNKEHRVFLWGERYAWWLTLVLIILLPLSGCDKSRQSLQSHSAESGSVMDLWHTYTHCYRSADLDEMRDDAQQLIQAANKFDSGENSSAPDRDEPAPSEPPTRFSVDPGAMAASCTLHTGQAAQKIGHVNVAREMFQLVVLRFPQSRYQYYAAQARLSLEHLNAASHATFPASSRENAST